jgi:hypothetical protein
MSLTRPLGKSVSDLTPLNRHRLQRLRLNSTRVEPLNTLEFAVPPESFELTLSEVASPFLQLSSALPVTALTFFAESNAQDLWIGARVAREGRTFPSDRLKVTE